MPLPRLHCQSLPCETSIDLITPRTAAAVCFGSTPRRLSNIILEIKMNRVAIDWDTLTFLYFGEISTFASFVFF